MNLSSFESLIEKHPYFIEFRPLIKGKLNFSFSETHEISRSGSIQSKL
jgi:hypothetical protein